MPKSRVRKWGSIKDELVKKSREAALAAVQIFNNPSITFKAESYVVLMVISWTYLLHAYYRSKKITYKYYKQNGQRRVYDRTKNGAYKYWELERCLNDQDSPIDKDTSNNLRFLIGLRHEIEHQMTSRIDDVLSARFQACCLNYNRYVKQLFGEKYGIEKHLSFSLQFSTIDDEQKDLLEEHDDLPKSLKSYIMNFDEGLSDEEYSSQHYAYRILFVPKAANRKNQADRVIEFVKSDDPLASTINKEYALLKEAEKKKYLPGQIVKMMKEEGFSEFSMHYHTLLWKEKDAKNSAKGFGVMVAGTHWHWYENWVGVVRDHCNKNKTKYTKQS